MAKHEPSHYRCPFCQLVAGLETDWNRRADIVYEDEETTAFVSPKWWETNPGHVLVVPNDHYENIYETPPEVLAQIYASTRRVAIAVRAAYECEGISTRQHNEPGAGQDVWHVHVHVYPRYEGDGLYENNHKTRYAAPEERAMYAEKLRAYFAVDDLL